MTKLGASPWNIRRRVVRCVEHQPARGTFADMWNIVEAWNIQRGVEHRGAHQGRFHSPRRFPEARVRRKGPGAHGESTFVSQLCAPSPSEEGWFLEGHVIIREIRKGIGAEV